MAMKVTLWCDQCPTLLDVEAFELDLKSRQILPRQDHTYQTQRLQLCAECFDKLMALAKPVKQNVSVKATIETPANGKRAAKS